MECLWGRGIYFEDKPSIKGEQGHCWFEDIWNNGYITVSGSLYKGQERATVFSSALCNGCKLDGLSLTRRPGPI